MEMEMSVPMLIEMVVADYVQVYLMRETLQGDKGSLDGRSVVCPGYPGRQVRHRCLSEE